MQVKYDLKVEYTAISLVLRREGFCCLHLLYHQEVCGLIRFSLRSSSCSLLCFSTTLMQNIHEQLCTNEALSFLFKLVY